jgi:hypothetical protein
VHTLPNGLRVVLIPYDAPGLVAYWTLMRAQKTRWHRALLAERPAPHLRPLDAHRSLP